MIDVRERREWNIVHLEGARHISLRQLIVQKPDLPLDTPVVLYCHHGSRSAMACMILERYGYSNLFNLDGGIDAYAREADPFMKTY